MGALDRRLFTARRELLQPELADRLQHPVTGLVPGPLIKTHETLCNERGYAVHDSDPARPWSSGPRPRGLQGEAAGKDGQPAKALLLDFAQQVIAPGDRIP